MRALFSVHDTAFQHILLVTIAIRLSVTVADAIVVAATWKKTFSQYGDASHLGMHAGVGTIMLRDGEYVCFHT